MNIPLNEKAIWDFLYAKTNNAYGTAALMGNLFAESSLNPINATGNKSGLTNEQYTAITDERKNDNFVIDNVAYGLVQWRFHTRKKGLYDLARQNETSVGNLRTQLEYLWKELQSYKTAFNAVCTATDIRTASDIVMLKYEKPGNTSEAAKRKRAEYGQKYFDMFAEKKDTLKVSKTKLTTAKNIIGGFLNKK